jgi:lipopolysaccharide/colanic/teichoic acid biosynthesis glycosyltransferase
VRKVSVSRAAGLAAKRVLDVAVAVTIAIAAAPLLCLIALVVRWTSPGPAVFRQPRVGKEARVFTLCKFRTMTDTRDPDGRLLLDRDRLTPVGGFLRKTSLDELPQLWNVLRGELSLVGPRPLPVHYYPYFTERERLRHSVRPGITGWAQVNGRNEASWDQRLAADVWYAENWSFTLDLRILIATVAAVLQRRGVVVDPRSTMLNLDEERRGQATATRPEQAEGRVHNA